jgi:hypothetical protein
VAKALTSSTSAIGRSNRRSMLSPSLLRRVAWGVRSLRCCVTTDLLYGGCLFDSHVTSWTLFEGL